MISFRSTTLVLDESGTVALDGELTLRGTTRPITATGRYIAPRPTPGGQLSIALALETRFDRRDFGMDWQMDIPGNGIVVGWDVCVDVEFELKKLAAVAGEAADSAGEDAPST
jgi:polyisoprenoid-binding protein YceI